MMIVLNNQQTIKNPTALAGVGCSVVCEHLVVELGELITQMDECFAHWVELGECQLELLEGVDGLLCCAHF